MQLNLLLLLSLTSIGIWYMDKERYSKFTGVVFFLCTYINLGTNTFIILHRHSIPLMCDYTANNVVSSQCKCLIHLVRRHYALSKGSQTPCCPHEYFIYVRHCNSLAMFVQLWLWFGQKLDDKYQILGCLSLNK